MNEPAFIRAQRAFARHLRDPNRVPAPTNLVEERIAVYRAAVYHNIERFMADNFPRVQEVLPAAHWASLVRDYLVRHSATTPVFARLPTEFLVFLEHERQAPADPPYLYELAHFDWLENFVATDEREIPTAEANPQGDLLYGTIVVNPVHTVQTYRFPVHVYNADFHPDVPPPQASHLVAFREPGDQYGVLDLNAVSYELFLSVRDDSAHTAHEILTGMAARFRSGSVAAVIHGGLDILTRMLRRGLILGTRET